MSTLVQLGRAAGHRAELQGPGGAVYRELVPAQRTTGPTTAADVMTRFPITVPSSASMWAAWDRLRTTGSRHVVVVDDHQRPLGVLDERSLALEWPSGPVAARRTPAHSLLRGAPRPRVLAGDEVAAVARTMLGAEVEAVPVVDRNGRLYGLVTLWHFAELAAARPTGEG